MKIDVELIIFDFDGVVADTGADIANAVNKTLIHFKRPVLSIGEIIGHVGHGAERLIRQCFGDVGDDMIYEALAFYKDYYLKNCILETVLYKNFKEMLEYYKNKKKAIVTNKPEGITLNILEKLGIHEFFNIIVGPESVKALKPDPEGLLKVLKELKADPKASIMVGDSYTDIEVGKAAGVYTCGVTYGLGDKNMLIESSPDFLIDDIIKLKEYII